jgi:hypothetical protein
MSWRRMILVCADLFKAAMREHLAIVISGGWSGHWR